MSDYSRQHDFNSKTGTTIFGSEVDEEFDALVISNNSKVDESREASANGIATLDGSALVPVAQLPAATETAIGAVELATTTEVQTGTDTTRAVTAAGVHAILDNAAGYLEDLRVLTDQGVDVLLGWDDSNKLVENFALGEGITTSGATVKVDLSELSTVAIVAGDTIPFYDISGAANGKTTFSALEAALDPGNMTNGLDTITITAGTGLSYSVGGTTIASDSTIDLDISALTDFGTSLVAYNDAFLIEDGGTLKRVETNDLTVPVSTVTGATDTLAAADMNTFISYTNSGAVTVTLNTGVGKAGNFVCIKQTGAGQVTVSGTATLQAAIGTKTRTQHSVITLFCTAANTWAVYGDANA